MSVSKVFKSDLDEELNIYRLLEDSTSSGSSENGSDLGDGCCSLTLDVIYHMLDICNDLQFVKTCRLVCKDWNDIACRVLRKGAVVRVDEKEEQKLDNFQQILLDRYMDFPHDWPNPFQNYHVIAESFNNPKFSKFIQRPSLNITSLDFVHGLDFNQSVFESIVTTQAHSITAMKIMGKRDAVFLIGLTQELTRLNSLKTFTLVDQCRHQDPCPTVHFVRTLLENNQLESLCLLGTLGNISECFGAQAQGKANNSNAWSKLKQLWIGGLWSHSSGILSPGDMEGLVRLAALPASSLSSLLLAFKPNIEDQPAASQYGNIILPLLQRSASTVKKIRVNFIPSNLLPPCPKLKVATFPFYDSDKFDFFTEAKFPSLTVLDVDMQWKLVPMTDSSVPPQPNSKVQNVLVKFHASPVSSVCVWRSLKHQFPGLTRLSLGSRANSGVFAAIRKWFPDLKCLEVEGDYAGMDLIGISPVDSWIQRGWAFEDILRKPSLVDLTELVDLNVRSAKVTPEVIEYCFARFSNLRKLRFVWNENLTIDNVLQHLKHVKEILIVIGYNEEVQYREMLDKLKSEMPNVQVIVQLPPKSPPFFS